MDSNECSSECSSDATEKSVRCNMKNTQILQGFLSVFIKGNHSQLTFTCLKSAIKSPGRDVKYFQSLQ